MKVASQIENKVNYFQIHSTCNAKYFVLPKYSINLNVKITYAKKSLKLLRGLFKYLFFVTQY